MKLFRSILMSAFLLTASFGLQAQQNYGIAYQAVARDAGGDALENATLDVRFTLLDAASSSVWSETHSGVLTDEFGLINLTIGSIAGADDLAAVDWSAGGYSFQVEVNSGGGFASFGMMAVTAVPVAMFAASAPEGTADSLSAVLAQEIADRAAGDAGLASDNATLAGLVASNAGNIATNESGVSSNAGAISANSGSISANAGDISTNAGGISTNAGGISSNAGDISTNAGGISTNAGGISTNAGGISTNSGDISTNAGGISTNAGDIATNSTAIGTNAGNIASNTTATGTNAGNIGQLQTDLATETSNRVSEDASLLGLIQSNDTDIAANAGSSSSNAAAIGTNAGDISQLQTDLGAETSSRQSEDATLLGLIQSNDGDILALNTSVGQLQSDLTGLTTLVNDNDHFDFSAGVLSTESDIDQLKVGSTVTMNATGASSVQLAVTGKILTTNMTVQNDLTVSDNITAGSASFTGNVLSTEAPIADDHLANKGYVDNVVDAEIAGYTQAIVDEETRALAAESALGARIDSLDGAHSSEIAQVQSNLDAEILATNGDVSSLQGQVDGNDGDITNIQGALDTLADDVNVNSAAAVSNFLAIQSNDGEIASNLAAIESNDGDITALQGVDDTLAIDVNANAAAIAANDGDIASNLSAIQSNDGEIATNLSAIQSNDGDITTLQGVDDTLAVDVNANAAAIVANDGDIASNLSEIQSNDGDITALQGVDDTLATDVNANAAAILANDGEIASNLAAIQSNDGDITALQGVDDTLAVDVNANAAAIVANDGDIASNLSEIQSNDGDITALQGVDDTLAFDVNANAAAILANDGDIASNLSAIVANDGEIASNLAAIQSNDGDITTLQGVDDTLAVDVNANAAAIVANDGDIASNLAAIVANDGEIASNLAAIQGNDGDITALQGVDDTLAFDVNANAAAIVANDGDIASNLSAIQSNDGDITALQGVDDTLATDVNTNAAATVSNFIAIQSNDSDISDNASDISTNTANIGSNDTDISNLQTELDGTQTGAGLGTDGAYTANGAANYISGSTSLVDADEDLDAAMKTLQDDVDANELASDNAEGALQTELDGTQTGAGLGTDGAYTANGAANYISGASSLANADDALDAQAKVNADGVATNAAAILSNDGDISTNASNIGSNDTDISNLQTELDGTQTGAGLGTDGAYTANGSTTYIAGSASLVDADEDLDAAMKSLQDDVDANELASDNAEGALQTELDGTQTGAGLGTDGAYTANGAANYISGSASLVDADEDLDAAMKTLQDDVDANELASDNAEGALQTELDGTQTGAGLGTDGAYTANGAANYISGSTSLVDADEDLDAAMKTLQDDVDANELASDNAEGALQTELDGTQTGAGLGTDGAYTANGAANYISGSTSLVDADEDLDAAMKTLQDDVDANELASDNAESALQSELDGTQTGAGLGTDGTYTANGATNYISGSTSLVDADEDLDGAIYDETVSRSSGDIFLNQLITTNTVAVAGNTASIGTLNSSVSTNAGDIGTLQTDLSNEISATNSDVTSLQSQIDNLPTSPAEIAAEVENNDYFDEPISGTISTESQISMVVLPALAVTGATNLEDVDIDGSLEVSAISTAQVETTGDVIVGDDVITTDDVNVGDRLTVAGTSAFTGASTFNGGLTGTLTGTASDISNHNTDALTEGTTNLYYTDTRSRGALSATDAGGDGSFAYNSATGVMTYTGPSAAETRAHFAGGTGVSITDGTVAIGQAVGTADNVQFGAVTANLTGNVTGNVSGNAGTVTNGVYTTNSVTVLNDVSNAGSGAIITDAERTKLNGIETAATADQTGAEIKTAYEAEAKAFTDAQFDKLALVEDGATADQTGAEIKTAYEAEAKAFTDAQFDKLALIEDGATADQTGAEIKTAYEAEAKAFTDAQFDKLALIEDAADVTDAANVAAAGAVMNTGDETVAGTKTFSSTIQGSVSGNAGTVTNGVYTTSSVANLSDVTSAGSGAIITSAERTKLNGIETAATADQTGAEIKTAYEAETKAFTDAQFDKLALIEASATANSTDATLLARANHTGTQAASTISDFDAEVSNNTSVAANTAKVSADGLVTTHSDVTSAGSGAIITSAERTKLNGIETAATADQTGAEIKTAYEAETKAFTDAQFDKLALIEASATANSTDATLLARANHTGTQAASTISDFDAEVSNNTSVAANTAKVSADGLVTTHSDVTSAGSGAIITSAERTKLNGIETAATADQTGAEIKTAYEAETKAFTDAQFDKLALIEAGATANSTDATLLARANHTGTQAASTISDFDAEVSNNTSVAANTAKVSADGLVTTHSDVTSAGSGAIITSAERTKLTNIEAAADVTDAANVAAAGAVMNTGDETIAGAKTFSSTIQGSVSGNAGTVTNGVYTTSSVANLSDVTSAGSGAIITSAERTKLTNLEDGADVTDAANVAAAGAVMNTGDETIAGAKTFSSVIQGDLNGNVTGTVSSIANHNTGNLAEGSNLYYTEARSRGAVSATDAGGDGSFAYNSATGVMTYTGPSAAEARAHFAGGTGVTITAGSVAIGQPVATTDAVTFASAATTGAVSVGGALGATGATTLGSTLDVAGAGEFDSSLGVDGNLRVGTGGASTFQVNSTSGALSTSGDISTTGGVQSTSLIATGTALLQGTTTASTLSVSNFLTLNNEPLLDSHAATKLYVDSRPQAYSFDQTGGNYQTNSDRLNITESNDFTLTISGASLAGATSYKLHYKGGEATLTLVSSTATTATLTLTDTAVTTLVGSDTEGQMMLSIDGAGTGLYVKF